MELSIYFSLLTSIDGMIEDSDEKDIDLIIFFVYHEIVDMMFKCIGRD
jgi:hypothetical protein